MSDTRTRPIFHDPRNRRWRWVRVIALALGGVVSLAFGIAIASVLVSPALPGLGLKSPRPMPGPGHLLPPPRQPWAISPRERAFQQAKKQLAEHQKKPAATPSAPPAGRLGGPEMSGFYVNWDDTSFTSLKANLASLDKVTAEWLHLASADGMVGIDEPDKIDRTLQYIRPLRPHMPIIALINNFRGIEYGWDAKGLAGMLKDPRARNRVIDTIVTFLKEKDLQGVNVDFENLPESGMNDLVTFMSELYAACHPLGLEVGESVPADDTAWPYAKLGHFTDYLVIMAYDEHYSGSEAGPLASQQWFSRNVRERMAEVGANKIVVALGNYGYDWKDKGKDGGNEISFQEAVVTAQESEGQIALDPNVLNPTYDYYDENDALHHVWFLNAVCTYNEMADTLPLAPRGFALWRLGSEDPSVWSIFGRHKKLDKASALSLATLHYGYDLDYEGKGEVLRVAATPKDGRRELRFDDSRGLIVEEHLLSYPSPYVIERWGSSPKKIALTFDDGPDPTFTPQILDALKRVNAPGTFFVLGVNAERYSGLLQRIVAEGNEVGNHTFSHPNIALISDRQLVLQLNATQRLFESRLGRRSVLFRPPYAEDVEPVTPEEVRPLVITSGMGYYTIGMLIDPSDWVQPGAAAVVEDTVDKAVRGVGNVVLLHDGGGQRSQTVVAVPLIVEALRARGFKLVGISELIGLSRDEVMPPVPKGDRVLIGVDDAVFILLGWGLNLLYALFMLGILLGCARLCFVGLLAVVQRWLDHRTIFPPDYVPMVSVVVPAFNEEKVVCQTVRALLESEYPDFEVIVVDDGSKDATFTRLAEEFGSNPKVRLFTKPNEGKAWALNFGIEHAEGHIIVALDADTVFLPGTLAKLARRFSDPDVGAVAGNSKVGNRINLHTCYQALEYITSQNMDRRAMDVLNCITVVPGSVGAWRKSLILEAGGFTAATLAEDADLTLTILEMGYKVAYEDCAVAYTEAPDTVRDFLRQRFRWMYGTLQAAWKHRRDTFNPRYGALGLFALPNVFLFQVFFPLISPVLDLFVVASLISSVVQERFHPASDSSHDFLHVLYYYAIFLAVDAAASVLAFVLERDEEWSLLLWLPLQRFIYRQLMYFVAVKSVYAAVKGRNVGWGKIERKATVSG